MNNKNSIKKSYNHIIRRISDRAKLLVVSKNQSLEDIQYVASLGQLDFGENYFQELKHKALSMPFLRWHFIGVLQSRKIKHIVQYVDYIQSVSKFKHFKMINQSASSLGKTVKLFLQINIDNDPGKSGFTTLDENSILDCIFNYGKLSNIEIVGLMCLPANSISSEKSFLKMINFFNNVNSKLSRELKLHRLSMGMTADYDLGIKSGSTDVRIGTGIFGERI